MVDSASEIDLESDASSVDGHPARSDQLQRQNDLLQQEKRVLKAEVEKLKLQVRCLGEQNQQLRRNSVSIQAKAEQEEEYITNKLQRHISELKKDKESLANRYEEEEERLTNELNRKLMQLQRENEKLERNLVEAQEAQATKLKRRIEKLESEKDSKQKALEKLRREKIELENALEQEQEAVVNRLRKKMDKLEAEKRMLQAKLESTSAPLSNSSSYQNIDSSASCTGQTHHTHSVCLGIQSQNPRQNQQHSPQQANSSGGSLRGSLRIPNAPNTPGGNSFDNLEFGGCVSDTGMSPPHLSSGRSSLPGGITRPLSFSPKPPQSPMDLDGVDGSASSSHRSEASLPATPGNRSHRNSYQFQQGVGGAFLNPGCGGGGGGAAQGASYPHLEGTAVGAAYVARLRDEVIRLRAMVDTYQSDQRCRSEQERIAMDENARLRRLVQAEKERKEMLSRNFSGSESSLEMEDERQFNEASRCITSPGRFRTTSDSLPMAYYTHGPSSVGGGGGGGGCVGGSGSNFIGPGSYFASAVAATTSSRSVSPRYCRECGQSLHMRPLAGDGCITPPPRSPGRFVKPGPRIRAPNVPKTTPPQLPQSAVNAMNTSGTTSDREFEYPEDDIDDEEDEERCKTPPAMV